MPSEATQAPQTVARTQQSSTGHLNHGRSCRAFGLLCAPYIHVCPQGTLGTHCSGTPLGTQGQLDEVPVAPTEHLWVAPSAGQHLTAHRARGVGSPSAPRGGTVLQPAGLGWPPRCCVPAPEEATQKLFCLPSRAKPRQTLGRRTDPDRHCPAVGARPPPPPPLRPQGSAWHHLPRMIPLRKFQVYLRKEAWLWGWPWLSCTGHSPQWGLAVLGSPALSPLV